MSGRVILNWDAYHTPKKSEGQGGFLFFCVKKLFSRALGGLLAAVDAVGDADAVVGVAG